MTLNWKYLSIFILCFSCGNSEIKQEKSTNSNEEIQFEFLNAQLNSTLKFPKKNKLLCLNHDLDSLTQAKEIYKIRIIDIDIDNKKELIHWHPFMGELSVIKKSMNEYEFVGIVGLAKEGSWESGFKWYDLIKYNLLIEDSSYSFTRKQIDIKLNFDEQRLNKYRAEINSRKECLDSDWEIAKECFPIIEQYEYQLFLALINGEYQFKNEYLTIRDRISITNAGAYSQDLEGNFLILSLLGIINKEEYDLSRIMDLSLKGIHKSKCY